MWRVSPEYDRYLVQGMSNDVALALESWWQMPALPGPDDDGDDGLLGPWREPGSEPVPVGLCAVGASAEHSTTSSRKKTK